MTFTLCPYQSETTFVTVTLDVGKEEGPAQAQKPDTRLMIPAL